MHVNQIPNTDATSPKNITSPSPLEVPIPEINDTLKTNKTNVKAEKIIAPSFAMELKRSMPAALTPRPAALSTTGNHLPIRNMETTRLSKIKKKPAKDKLGSKLFVAPPMAEKIIRYKSAITANSSSENLRAQRLQVDSGRHASNDVASVVR